MKRGATREANEFARLGKKDGRRATYGRFRSHPRPQPDQIEQRQNIFMKNHSGQVFKADKERHESVVAHHPATLKILNLPQRLSDTEKQQLARCEAVIATGWNTFIDVGKALAVVKESQLYRNDYATFAEYCRRKWQYGKSHAYRLIGAAEVIESLTPIGELYLPTHEAQVRCLIGLLPPQARAVWTRAVHLAEGKLITSKHVKQAMGELLKVQQRNCCKKQPAPRHAKLPRSRVERALKLLSKIESSLEVAGAVSNTQSLVSELRTCLTSLTSELVEAANQSDALISAAEQ